MKTKYLFISALLLSIILTKCAKVSSPSGGPKDSIPPQIISSEPDNYSTNIDETSIEITFDEFIQLKDINGNLIISPPVEEKPIVKLRGKSVSIDLNNELKDSTTYTLNFGNSIVDNNEGNPLENFEFVFSTNSFLDSFSITGLLLNSFTLEPPENPIFVTLYKNLADTAPLTEVPYYISRTDKEGKFGLNNIASGKYRLFAIEDANNNLFYDLPNEKIAFFDSIITIDTSIFANLNYIKTQHTDSLNIDSLNAIVEHDSVLTNNPVFKKKYAFYAPLYLFEESLPNQYLIDNNRNDKHKLQIILNEPLRDSIQFILWDSITPIAVIHSFNSNWDTLTFWLSDTVKANLDSLNAVFSFYATDSIRNYYWKTDTLNFNYRKAKEPQLKRGKKPEKEPEETNPNIKIKTQVSSNKPFNLNGKIRIDASYPIDTILHDSIELYIVEDSLKKPEKFEIIKEADDLTRFSIFSKWKPSTKYEFNIFPGGVKNIYHYAYDSLQISFKTREKEYYGTLILDVKGYNHSLIIQLMPEDKTKILDERYCKGDTSLIFDYLQPQTYQLKMIHDLDSNKKWTTGNYLKNEQPEKIEYFDKPQNIRSNWEIQEKWEKK